jgi:hypothetical protein
MLFLTLAMLASPAEIPADGWTCRNQLEVWCAADGCAAAREGEFTPLDIHASVKGELSVCAYSGCWETASAPVRKGGRILWAADDVAFSSGADGAMTADVTLLIVEKDGVGFVRVGGLATPLLCVRTKPGLQESEEQAE